MARRPDKGASRQGGGRERSERASRRPRDVHPYRDPARREGEERSRQHPDDKLIRIAGLPSVAELFETGADRVERLYFEASHRNAVQQWCTRLAQRHKIYRQLRPDEMQRVAGTAMHGGIVALARPRPVRSFDPATAERWALDGRPIIVLDGIGNPQNIGAIARTAAFYGIKRLILSDHPGQSGLSDTSYRIAKGGLEWIDVYRAERLPEVLQRLAASYQVVGTAVRRATSPEKLPRTAKPIALVLGNEEEGLPPATLAACPAVVALTGSGHVQSLNVSAAAAILIHTLLARA